MTDGQIKPERVKYDERVEYEKMIKSEKIKSKIAEPNRPVKWYPVNYEIPLKTNEVESVQVKLDELSKPNLFESERIESNEVESNWIEEIQSYLIMLIPLDHK